MGDIHEFLLWQDVIASGYLGALADVGSSDGEVSAPDNVATVSCDNPMPLLFCLMW